jgi:hypothetical protein
MITSMVILGLICLMEWSWMGLSYARIEKEYRAGFQKSSPARGGERRS